MYSNKSDKTNVKNNISLSIIFFLLIILAGLNHSSNFFSNIGFLCIGILMLMGTFIFLVNIGMNKYIIRKEMSIYVFSILFISIYLISILNSLNMTSIIMSIQVSMVIFFFWGVVFFPFRLFNFKIGYYIIIIFICFHFCWLILKGFEIPFSGVMNNPNPFGAFISMILGIFMIFKNNYEKANKYIYLIALIMGLILIYSSNSRTVWLLILTFVITYFIWPIVIKLKILFNFYFIFITFLLFLVTVWYPKLLYTSLGYKLQDLSRLYTGKNFFSGRQVLWADILNKIGENPIWGYGPATRPSNLNIIDTGLSAHNYYLQMTLQVGILGTIIFLLLLFSIWNYLYIAKYNNTIRIVASLIISMFIYQLFEVAFTQNILAVAMLQWFIIGIGVHFTRKEYIKNNKIMVFN
jgi:O-antigen ligase